MIDFASIHRIHVVGIKGAGVSALASILHAQGKEVCGSDIDEEFFTETALHNAHIRCEQFSSRHVAEDPLDAVIYSTAWKDSDEVAAAHKRGIPTLSYPEALGAVLNKGFGIAIAGSHGKTTTTAMVAYILKEAGCDPSAIIGSLLSQYGTNALSGSSPYIVIEADEYENKFLYYNPRALLVTNIDYDHPDFFSTPAEYDNTFFDVIKKVSGAGGTIVTCADDPGISRVLSLLPAVPVTTYGIQSEAPYRASDVRQESDVMYYTLIQEGKKIGHYSLKLFGEHNVENALGAIALCDALGLVPAKTSGELLQSFNGTARRFEYKGVSGSTVVYDDFAHHPAEIKATLRATRQAFPDKRIWCVFGAHTFSRTQSLLKDFATSFSDANKALILDIYGSAREQEGTILGSDLALAIDAVSANTEYVGTLESALGLIRAHIDEIDVLITMGAGDVWRIADDLVKAE